MWLQKLLHLRMGPDVHGRPIASSITSEPGRGAGEPVSGGSLRLFMHRSTRSSDWNSSAVYHMPDISMLPSAHSIVIPGSGGKVTCIVEAEHYVGFKQERDHQIRNDTELHFRAM